MRINVSFVMNSGINISTINFEYMKFRNHDLTSVCLNTYQCQQIGSVNFMLNSVNNFNETLMFL
jgi:hypothetical protein